MAFWLDERTEYSRAERISDGIIHVAGIVSALIAAAVLITLTALWSEQQNILVGTIIYCITLISMICASAAYHLTPYQGWKSALQRLDHSAIYLKIAGTYTPFTLLAGADMWLFLAGIWVAAIAGTILRTVFHGQYFNAGLMLYVGMGWAGIWLAGDMLAALDPATVRLMIMGGVVYTIGVAFWLSERLLFHNTIWHVFVLIATGIFYTALVIEIAGLSMAQAGG